MVVIAWGGRSCDFVSRKGRILLEIPHHTLVGSVSLWLIVKKTNLFHFRPLIRLRFRLDFIFWILFGDFKRVGADRKLGFRARNRMIPL